MMQSLLESRKFKNSSYEQNSELKIINNSSSPIFRESSFGSEEFSREIKKIETINLSNLKEKVY